jgi:hypothetical protein
MHHGEHEASEPPLHWPVWNYAPFLVSHLGRQILAPTLAIQASLKLLHSCATAYELDSLSRAAQRQSKTPRRFGLCLEARQECVRDCTPVKLTEVVPDASWHRSSRATTSPTLAHCQTWLSSFVGSSLGLITKTNVSSPALLAFNCRFASMSLFGSRKASKVLSGARCFHYRA